MNTNKRFLVYTAIFGNYDTLKDPLKVSTVVDYICFTDSKDLKSNVWKIIHVDLSSSPSLLNRELKLLYPHREFFDYDYSLYVDGSILIKEDVAVFFEKYAGKYPVMNFKHPNNDCIFKEIINCIKLNKGNPEKLIQQYNVYLSEGMPKHWGLSDNKIILRDNHSELNKEMMEEWFEHVANYSGRDQVCLAYVYYKHNYSFHFFEEDITDNLFFETWPHTSASKFIWAWRNFKLFCEKHSLFLPLIKFLNKKVKPIVLKYV